jgi:hypothetical protein
MACAAGCIVAIGPAAQAQYVSPVTAHHTAAQSFVLFETSSDLPHPYEPIPTCYRPQVTRGGTATMNAAIGPDTAWPY